MPIKSKNKNSYHKGHPKERHSKRFIKAYAPYLPLIMIVLSGLFISFQNNIHHVPGRVLAYATNMSDSGLLDATNKERLAKDLRPLRFNSQLDEAAQNKAQDMADRDYWSHNTPENKEPWVFIEKSGYRYFKAAENLAYGFDDSKMTIAGWMNSATHRSNVLDADVKDVGFGIVNVPNYQNRGPQTIVVAMYGLSTPEMATATPASTNTVPSVQITHPSPSDNQEKAISYAQALSGGAIPWSTFAIGIILGSASMYLVSKHTRGIHRVFRRGERFIIKHPILDSTLVALIVLATVIVQTAGVIQ